MALNLSSENMEQLFRELKSGPNGLSGSLAARRYKQQLKLFKTDTRFKRELKLFIRQFTNPLVMLLVIAVLLAAILKETTDALIILFILLATGLMSFLQEVHADRAVEKLQKMIALKHRVLRAGKEEELPTREIVPGDVILLEAGDVIPGDCRLIESNELHVNESTLTGESYPVEKMPGELPEDTPLNKKNNCLWQSTNVINGTATALVVNTAGNTIFGKMAHSLTRTPETAFERGIKHFGYFLLQVTIILSVIILVINVNFHRSLFESVLFSLALAIGMAPELLPAIMTFAMSAGANRMMKKKVIVKKLSSIFNFGEVNILCTDKTGTITEGTVKVKDIVNSRGEPNEQIKLYACINSAFQKGLNNPIDEAIKALPVKTEGYEKLDEIPYDFIRKRLSVAIKHGNEKLLITKGALKNILDVCTFIENENGQQTLDYTQRKNIEKQFEIYSQDGLRVLGICYKMLNQDRINRDNEQEMIFLGFILLEDPLKESSIASIERLKKMDVSIKIITGDNRYTAGYTAKKIGIQSPKIITGDALDRMSPEALTVNAYHTDIFAEIEPHQKERIVKSLQKSNFVVAYVGDGINDVAAIHAADTGISTNNAVDVAKEAADFVLLEKDLSVLADGIYEGRKSFQNSMKYIFINTGSTFGSMFSVALASLLLPFLPMLPKQILLTNFITDFPYLSVSSDNIDPEILEKPQPWNIGLLRSFMIVFGLHTTLFDLSTFYVLFRYLNLKGSNFQTGWFLESVITQILILFVIRTRRSILKSKPGKLLLITNLIALLITIWLPISPFAGILSLNIAHFKEIAIILAIVIAYVITAELLKIAFFRFVRRRKRH